MAPEPDRVRGLAGALASPGVRTLLGTMIVVGAGVGIIEVAVPALCEAAGAPSATGFVLGLWGLGSLVGGVVASRLSRGRGPGPARDRAARPRWRSGPRRSCSPRASSRSAR